MNIFVIKQFHGFEFLLRISEIKGFRIAGGIPNESKIYEILVDQWYQISKEKYHELKEAWKQKYS